MCVLIFFVIIKYSIPEITEYQIIRRIRSLYIFDQFVTYFHLSTRRLFSFFRFFVFLSLSLFSRCSIPIYQICARKHTYIHMHLHANWTEQEIPPPRMMARSAPGSNHATRFHEIKFILRKLPGAFIRSFIFTVASCHVVYHWCAFLPLASPGCTFNTVSLHSGTITLSTPV